MFNKNDFINWAQTAQNDNKPMQDFRSSHFNPMKQVQQVDEWIAPALTGLKTVAVPALKTVGKEVARDVGTTVAKKGIEKVGDKLKPKAKLETEGVKGEIAGGVAGSIAGGVAGGAIGNALGGKEKQRKPVQKPVTAEHASYESRKEAGMRAMREFFGHQKNLGLGKAQIKQRAKQSQDAYGSEASSGFKFGRPLAHQEPKEKPKV